MSELNYARSWKEAVPNAHGWKDSFRIAARQTLLDLFSLTASKTLPDSFLRPIFCHYVFDDQKVQFEQILRHLTSFGNFVSTNDLVAMLQSEQPIEGRYFHLSFDDGFQNIYANAFPVLKELEIPALFFVPTRLIGGDWTVSHEFCLGPGSYAGVIEMANWCELEEMSDHGIDIGSHTCTHARLASISTQPNELKTEIEQSKAEIESKLGQPCRYFSWPYGTKEDVDANSLKVVQDAGYEACFGAFRGSVKPQRTDLWQIPRHHFEPQWPLRHVDYFARGHGE